MAAPPDHPKSPNRTRKPDRAEENRRFARAMARAELGKNYWNESAERALREAMSKKKPRN